MPELWAPSNLEEQQLAAMLLEEIAGKRKRKWKPLFPLPAVIHKLSVDERRARREKNRLRALKRSQRRTRRHGRQS